MNEKQREALRAIVGDEMAADLERTGVKRTQELESTVDYKAKGEKQESFAKVIRGVLGKIEDEAVRKQIESIANALEDAYPKPQKQIVEEEEEEKPKSEKELAEGTKAGKLADNAKRLRMLGGRVGGVVGDKLQKIAADILKFAESEGPTKPAKANVKPEEEEYPKPGKKDFEDVVESVKTITEHFSSRFDDVAEAVKSIAGAVAGLVAEVEALKRDDAKKMAELVEDTPAASLKAIVQSVIGQKDAQLDGRSSLAKDGPKVTTPDDSAGGGSLGIFPKDWFTGPTAS